MQPLAWPDCRNTRDLGGLPATGGEIRTGRLIRSDNLDQLTPAGLAAVHAARISRFVDLRSAWECETFRSPYVDDPRLVNVPLWDPGDPDISELGLFEQYRILLDDYAERVAAAIVAIADAPPGCVVVSCHAGKDRTGVVVALTLALVGVPRELVAADYEASGASRETIVRVLDHVRTQYGGTAAYLLNSGATTEQLDGLSGRLTG
ncbi:tyrosine-protein phosphatase [Kribbella sp. NPDC049584]|uniref:tyrosine-protein phosphatase n=1 Tax=Kribbella sp. NPDC049584 TaxID=3154833 RepID=UPI003442BB82